MNGEQKVKKEDSGGEGEKQDFGLNGKRASGRSAYSLFFVNQRFRMPKVFRDLNGFVMKDRGLDEE